jgi:hypothetical protein
MSDISFINPQRPTAAHTGVNPIKKLSPLKKHTYFICGTSIKNSCGIKIEELHQWIICLTVCLFLDKN